MLQFYFMYYFLFDPLSACRFTSAVYKNRKKFLKDIPKQLQHKQTDKEYLYTVEICCYYESVADDEDDDGLEASAMMISIRKCCLRNDKINTAPQCNNSKQSNIV
uniref:Uncharacterized protein n=1 Tax=Glossina pallidipes TaxID=7398 RepID=A0A1A9Z8V4_GLOPL